MYRRDVLPRWLGLCFIALNVNACGDGLEPVMVGSSALSIGLTHVCVVHDGAPVCWGENERKESGQPQGAIITPARVPVSDRFTAVSAGLEHSCGLTEDGRAFCWGANSAGQLGNGDGSPPAGPLAVKTDLRFTSISAGDMITCALTADARAWCWGYYRAVGTDLGSIICSGGVRCHPVPVPVAGDHTFHSLSAGRSYVCGVETSGTLWCWGENSLGQLGTGDQLYRQTPTAVPAAGPFVAVDVGTWGNTCAVTASAEIWCWGDNSFSQLGPSSSGPETCFTQACSTRPVRIATQPPILITVSANRTICGVSVEAKGYCWGYNIFSQVGDGGSAANRTLPTEVPGNLKFAVLETTGDMTCGITTRGDVYCWGTDEHGMLGDGMPHLGFAGVVRSPMKVEIK